MNKIIKNLLSKRQYQALSNIKSILKNPQMIHAGIIEKMDYVSHEIFLEVHSEMEYETRLHSCKKEPETIKWIETLLHEGDILYDVGANIGAYSLVASKYFNGKVKIYAFEPAFTNFPQLCKNIYINQCQDSIVPLPIALSDRTTIEIFNYSNLIPGGALHTLGDTIDDMGRPFIPVYTQPVLSYCIDDLILQFDVPPPTHIKLDVDGAEISILKGAEKTLSHSHVKSIICELCEGEKADYTTQFLESKGFAFHSRHNRYTPGLFNYIFERTAK